MDRGMSEVIRMALHWMFSFDATNLINSSVLISGAILETTMLFLLSFSLIQFGVMSSAIPLVDWLWVVDRCVIRRIFPGLDSRGSSRRRFEEFDGFSALGTLLNANEFDVAIDLNVLVAYLVISLIELRRCPKSEDSDLDSWPIEVWISFIDAAKLELESLVWQNGSTNGYSDYRPER